MSPNAVAQAPTKMGFKAGSQITVDNAIKTIMVKSANDMSVMLAEGVVRLDRRLRRRDEPGRRPARHDADHPTSIRTGLPADEQITSARDLAILARAVYRELPEYEMYWRISAIKYGKRVMRNYNTLLDRYPGTDGMKTGFICASGFNIVVSARRNGRRLIAVMLGAPSGGVRAVKVAQMLERGFQTGSFNWLTSAGTTVDQLRAIDAPPPNLRDEICGKKRKRPAAESEDVDEDDQRKPRCRPAWIRIRRRRSRCRACAPPTPSRRRCSARLRPSMEPVEVFLGAYKGAVPVADRGRPKKKAKKKNVAARRIRLRRRPLRRGRSGHRGKASAATGDCAGARRQANGSKQAAVGSGRQHRNRPLQPAPPCRRRRRPRRRNPTPSGAPANAEATAKPPAQKPAASAQPAAR